MLVQFAWAPTKHETKWNRKPHPKYWLIQTVGGAWSKLGAEPVDGACALTQCKLGAEPGCEGDAIQTVGGAWGWGHTHLYTSLVHPCIWLYVPTHTPTHTPTPILLICICTCAVIACLEFIILSHYRYYFIAMRHSNLAVQSVLQTYSVWVFLFHSIYWTPYSGLSVDAIKFEPHDSSVLSMKVHK